MIPAAGNSWRAWGYGGSGRTFRHQDICAVESVVNIARVAVPTSLTIASENKISALNDGFAPENSFDRSHGLYALCGRSVNAAGSPAGCNMTGASRSTSTRSKSTGPSIVRVPGALPGSYGPPDRCAESYRILYWNGSDFVPVNSHRAWGRTRHVQCDDIRTCENQQAPARSCAAEGGAGRILEWRVFNFGPVPALPPVIDAGVDRSVVRDGKTYLAGKVTWLEDSPQNSARWLKTSGPGAVAFEDATSPVTTATFSAPGEYVLTLAAIGSKGPARTIGVHVEAGTAQRSAGRGLHPEILHRQPLLERARQGAHRELDSSLHRDVRAHRHPCDARRRRHRQLHRSRQSQSRRAARHSTRAMSSPTPGSIRLSSPCASR